MTIITPHDPRSQNLQRKGIEHFVCIAVTIGAQTQGWRILKQRGFQLTPSPNSGQSCTQIVVIRLNLLPYIYRIDAEFTTKLKTKNLGQFFSSSIQSSVFNQKHICCSLLASALQIRGFELNAWVYR